MGRHGNYRKQNNRIRDAAKACTYHNQKRVSDIDLFSMTKINVYSNQDQE